MNAPLRKLNLDVDQYLVIFGDGVATVSKSREDIEHEIASTDFGSGPDSLRRWLEGRLL